MPKRDSAEDVFPCGHSRKQIDSLKLGCTEGSEIEEPQCRPLDELMSRQYWASKERS